VCFNAYSLTHYIGDLCSSTSAQQPICQPAEPSLPAHDCHCRITTSHFHWQLSREESLGLLAYGSNTISSTRGIPSLRHHSGVSASTSIYSNMPRVRRSPCDAHVNLFRGIDTLHMSQPTLCLRLRDALSALPSQEAPLASGSPTKLTTSAPPPRRVIQLLTGLSCRTHATCDSRKTSGSFGSNPDQNKAILTNSVGCSPSSS
jgi:hypothetical protein